MFFVGANSFVLKISSLLHDSNKFEPTKNVKLNMREYLVLAKAYPTPQIHIEIKSTPIDVKGFYQTLVGLDP